MENTLQVGQLSANLKRNRGFEQQSTRGFDRCSRVPSTGRKQPTLRPGFSMRPPEVRGDGAPGGALSVHAFWAWRLKSVRRSPPGAPSRHFRRSRKTASAPGRVSWDEAFTSPSPASTLQNGRSAVRLDARSRPGTGLRGRYAGFRIRLHHRNASRWRPRMSRTGI
mgnify:CR=1 FL=1